VIQVISVLGVLAILVAYAANQLRWIGLSNHLYAPLPFWRGHFGRGDHAGTEMGIPSAKGGVDAQKRVTLVRLLRSGEVGSG